MMLYPFRWVAERLVDPSPCSASPFDIGDPLSTNLSPSLSNHAGQPSCDASADVGGPTYSTMNLVMSVPSSAAEVAVPLTGDLGDSCRVSSERLSGGGRDLPEVAVGVAEVPEVAPRRGCLLLHDAATGRHGVAHHLVHRLARGDDEVERDTPEAGSFGGDAGVSRRCLPLVQRQRR